MSGRGPKVGPSNPGRRVEGGGGISRRSFLKSVGIGLGVAGIGGLGLAEHNTRKKHEDTIAELLEGATFHKEIRGIKIYVGNSSMLENGRLLKGLIESLEPMISILSDKMVGRMRFIKLQNAVNYLIVPVPFEGESYVFVGGMILTIYPKRFENGILPEDRLAEAFFHEAAHLITFGNPDEFLKSLRLFKLTQCKSSFKKCILSLTDLIAEQFVEEWVQISEQNGNYISAGRITVGQVREEDLIGYKNFGYVLDDPNLDYGRLNFAEDIACVFEDIFSSLYKVIHRNENPKTVISALLSKTPGETGLYRKYQIACESLIGWYEKNSDQRKILREFIKIIKDAIKEAQGATNGQSIQTIKDTIKAKGTTNGQSTQTIENAIRAEGTTSGQSSQPIQGAKEPEGTTGVQETPLGRLMRRRLDEIRKSGRQGPS